MESTSLAQVRTIMSSTGWSFATTNHIWAMEVKQCISRITWQEVDSILWDNVQAENTKVSNI